MGVLYPSNSCLFWILAFVFLMVYKFDCSFVINMEASTLDLNDNQQLAINCTFYRDQKSGNNSPNIEIIPKMKNLNQKQLELKSLAIYKIRPAYNEHHALVFIDGTNKYSQYYNHHKRRDTYSIDGHIDQSSTSSNPISFIAFVWNSPSPGAGIYTCVADIIDIETNIPYTLSRDINVYDVTSLGLFSQSRKISSLERKLEIEQMSSYELKRKIKELEKRKMKYENILSHRMSISTEYQNHIYLASKVKVPNNDKAQEICQSLGGYLLELTNDDEWRFVKRFLFSLNLGKLCLFIGARDDEEEGKWYWMHSKTPMTIHPWNLGEPNDKYSREDCVEVHLNLLHTGFVLNDLRCDYAQNGFICEIPN